MKLTTQTAINIINGESDMDELTAIVEALDKRVAARQEEIDRARNAEALAEVRQKFSEGDIAYLNGRVPRQITKIDDDAQRITIQMRRRGDGTLRSIRYSPRYFLDAHTRNPTAEALANVLCGN